VTAMPFSAFAPVAGVEPDAPALPAPSGASASAGAGFGAAVRDAFEAAGAAIGRADAAESAFVHGRGSLQAMEVERAQADVMLGLETAAVSRGSQALTSLLNMQV